MCVTEGGAWWSIMQSAANPTNPDLPTLVKCVESVPWSCSDGALDITMPAASPVAIRVLVDGEPAEGARVMVSGDLTSDPFEVVPGVTAEVGFIPGWDPVFADADGVAALMFYPSAGSTYSVTASLVVNGVTLVTSLDGVSTDLAEVELVLPASPTLLAGSVFDTSGRPVPGLTVHGSNDDGAGSGITDAAGAFSFYAPAGTVDVALCVVEGGAWWTVMQDPDSTANPEIPNLVGCVEPVSWSTDQGSLDMTMPTAFPVTVAVTRNRRQRWPIEVAESYWWGRPRAWGLGSWARACQTRPPAGRSGGHGRCASPVLRGVGGALCANVDSRSTEGFEAASDRASDVVEGWQDGRDDAARVSELMAILRHGSAPECVDVVVSALNDGDPVDRDHDAGPAPEQREVGALGGHLVGRRLRFPGDRVSLSWDPLLTTPVLVAVMSPAALGAAQRAGGVWVGEDALEGDRASHLWETFSASGGELLGARAVHGLGPEPEWGRRLDRLLPILHELAVVEEPRHHEELGPEGVMRRALRLPHPAVVEELGRLMALQLPPRVLAVGWGGLAHHDGEAARAWLNGASGAVWSALAQEAAAWTEVAAEVFWSLAAERPDQWLAALDVALARPTHPRSMGALRILEQRPRLSRGDCRELRRREGSTGLALAIRRHLAQRLRGVSGKDGGLSVADADPSGALSAAPLGGGVSRSDVD